MKLFESHVNNNRNSVRKMIDLQCRMARAALGLGVRDLAKLAGVSPDTISRLERGEKLKDETILAIGAVLEREGIIFVAENGDGPGVRLKKSAKNS